MDEIVHRKKGLVAGELKIGIIPTLAPYLLPLFVQNFTRKYPLVRLVVNELTTDLIVSQLRSGHIDMGILVTPLLEPGIKEHVLFYEELMAYVSKKNEAYQKTYMLPQDIDPNKLWLLEEGHCFRSQIVNLCELRKASRDASNFDYEAGSIETLRRMVDMNDGITILPELATLGMTTKQLGQIRYFKRPAPMREVSIIVHRDFVKKRLIEILKEEILASIPSKISLNKSKYVVPV
jgi:LysR family hydrogen peroxide-inducible transcriptional activator